MFRYTVGKKFSKIEHRVCLLKIIVTPRIKSISRINKLKEFSFFSDKINEPFSLFAQLVNTLTAEH